MAKFFLSAFADEASDLLDGQIKALQRNGIHGIEPRSMQGAVIKKTDAELKEIKKKLDDASIIVPSLGSPIGKYDIHKEFAPHLEEFKRTLEVCHLLGTSRMRMFSFFVPQNELAKCRQEVMKRLSIMLELAKKEGITLCHENEKGIYGQNPKEVADLLKNLPDLKGIHDPANYVQCNADTKDGLEATFVNFEYLHMKDALYNGGIVVPVGKGEGKVNETLEYVDKNVNKEVILTLEPHLFAFEAYKQIDNTELKNLYSFENSNESFDFAVKCLKELLESIGHPVMEGKA